MAGDQTPLLDLRNRPTAEESARQNLSAASQGYMPSLQWVQVVPPEDWQKTDCRPPLAIESPHVPDTPPVNFGQNSAFHRLQQGHEISVDHPVPEKDHQLIRQPHHSTGILQDSSTRELLHHYTNIVAAQMVWVDAVQNPFREIIIPLAIQSPALMMSILSVAAGDMWSRSGQTVDCNFDSSRLLDLYRGQTLSHLVDHLRIETGYGSNTSAALADNDRASPILAAFLLGSLGLKMNDFSAWRLHNRAAWSMLEHWTSSTPNATDPFPGIKKFLLQEVYCCKVWESVTTFQASGDMCGAASLLNSEGPFVQYLGIISTLAEVERSQTASCEELDIDLTLPTLVALLAGARERTEDYANTITFHLPGARRAFEHLVDLYHHAGMLYGCLVLSGVVDSTDIVNSSRVALFQRLYSVTGTEIIAQDLTWPVFIAGTECQGQPENQRLIQEKMQEIMIMSGDLERPRLLAFLAELWLLQQQGTSTNWIKLARAYADRGEPILIV
ncbi:hypothetical protein LTS15_000620 [Exophiala xenobiotica]|nr:hypothetical protein LTS15_000620 [Exophiala xenobiotica]